MSTTIYIVVAILLLLVIGVVIAAICTAQGSSCSNDDTGSLSPSASSLSCSSDSNSCDSPFFFTGATGPQGDTGATGASSSETLAYAEFCFTGAGLTGTVSPGDAFAFDGAPIMFPANTFLQPLTFDEVTVPNVGVYDVSFQLYSDAGAVAVSIYIGANPLPYATFGRKAIDAAIFGRALITITNVITDTISIVAAVNNVNPISLPVFSSATNTNVSTLILRQIQ